MNEQLNGPVRDDEVRLTQSVLARLTPGQLPLYIFIEVARLTVTPTVEVVPLRMSVTGEVEVLLIEREASDPIWGGMLHTPGTVVRVSDMAEDNADAFARIFHDELGSVDTSKPVFVKNLFHHVLRGAEQTQIYYIEVLGKPVNGTFYNAQALPDNVVDTQLDFIASAVTVYEAGKQQDS